MHSRYEVPARSEETTGRGQEGSRGREGKADQRETGKGRVRQEAHEGTRLQKGGDREAYGHADSERMKRELENGKGEVEERRRGGTTTGRGEAGEE